LKKKKSKLLKKQEAVQKHQPKCFSFKRPTKAMFPEEQIDNNTELETK
jgi:hypothetical protein